MAIWSDLPAVLKCRQGDVRKCLACVLFSSYPQWNQGPAGKWPPRQSCVPQCNSVYNKNTAHLSCVNYYEFYTCSPHC